MLEKKKVLDEIVSSHAELLKLIYSLSSKQKQRKVLGEWRIKDVIAHLAAWNKEVTAEVDRVLQDNATWPELYESKEEEDEFNKREVEKRSHLSFEQVLNEWEDSHNKLLQRLCHLNNEQWNHASGSDIWKLGRFKDTPVTVWSLFDYEYEGQSHEAGHTKQIKQVFGR